MSPARAPSADPPAECDVAVVGGGIVGLAVARELALRQEGISVAVLEREARLASHQTGHSSGVIHSGVFYERGSLKARLCVAGADELYRYCEERGIDARRSGKLIVATREGELGRLSELERRGVANGVPGLARVEADEIRAIEPHATGIAALHSPATGVVDFARVAHSYAADVATAGGTIATGCEVHRLRDHRGKVSVDHASGSTRARAVAICAGAWGDRIARAAGAPRDPVIVPFRGAYLRLRAERASLVRGNLYPVPDPALPFLGAHLTRTIEGDVLLGPSALLVAARDAYEVRRLSGPDLREALSWPGTYRLAARHWRTGLREIALVASRRAFVASARRLVPELRPRDFVGGPAGVRAQAVGRDGSLVDDFVLSSTARCLFVRNAPSPAATSALPLARLIADRLEPMLDA